MIQVLRTAFGPAAEVYRFIRSPRTVLAPFASRYGELRFYAHLWLITLIAEIAWIVALGGIKDDAGISSRGFGAPTATLFFALAVFVPLYEELLFRSWLTRSAFLLVLAPYFFVRYLMPFLSWATAIQLTAYLILASSLVLKKEKLKAWTITADAVLRRWLPYTLAVSTVTFSLSHIPNYDIPAGQLWITPFLVIPQAICGLAMAYARVRSGLAISIAFHASINALVFLALWLESHYV